MDPTQFSPETLPTTVIGLVAFFGVLLLAITVAFIKLLKYLLGLFRAAKDDPVNAVLVELRGIRAENVSQTSALGKMAEHMAGFDGRMRLIEVRQTMLEETAEDTLALTRDLGREDTGVRDMRRQIDERRRSRHDRRSEYPPNGTQRDTPTTTRPDLPQALVRDREGRR